MKIARPEMSTEELRELTRDTAVEFNEAARAASEAVLVALASIDFRLRKLEEIHRRRDDYIP